MSRPRARALTHLAILTALVLPLLFETAQANEQVRQLQTVLSERNCYDGAIDGGWGRMSEAAAAAFTIASGIEIALPVTRATVAKVEASDAACATPSSEGPVASPFLPEFTTSAPEVVYSRAQLLARGLRYWPDGNLGFVPSDRGKTIFLAANSERSARTIGTLEDPAASVTATGIDIKGISKTFAYRAGGPLYRDLDSGMLLMVYHAERHYSGTYAFYSEIGMAASTDDGRTFHDLGIVLSPHVSPSSRGTVEMGGGTFAIKDGYVYVFFRDTLSPGIDVNLAVARASLEDVVAAAKRGETAQFRKYFGGGFTEPGLAGRSSPLELGNPLNRWMSVTYDTALDRFLIVIDETMGQQRTLLSLIASKDGISWSPRKELVSASGELFYPSMVGAAGNPLATGKTFDVYFTASHNWRNRWADASLERVAVTLTGRMVELPHAWTFDTAGDTEGWVARNQIASLDVFGGNLAVKPSGYDPYLVSPPLGLPAGHYTKIAVRLKTDATGVGQFFFTSSANPQFTESNSRRFPITPGSFHTYTVDMSGLRAWNGTIGQLRFDPTDQSAPVTIDSIRLLP